MVSFRFHLVSLVAVFLALALGIGMGVTVIDKATVDLLQNQLNSVRVAVDDANQRSGQLQAQLDQADDFSEAANNYLVSGRLDDVEVTIIRIEGIDTTATDRMAQTIQAAGGAVRGTFTLTERLALRDEDDARDLRAALGAGTDSPDQLLTAALARIDSVLIGTDDGNALSGLVSGGFVQWSAGPNTADLGSATFAGTRVVLASGTGAVLGDEQVAIPLARLLADQPSTRAVAVESGVAAVGDTPEARAVFVGPLRDDSDVRDSVSTVDDLETTAGRIATVLALSQLSSGQVGHYGVANSASAILPPAS